VAAGSFENSGFVMNCVAGRERSTDSSIVENGEIPTALAQIRYH
jgi:hypothetical protein